MENKQIYAAPEFSVEELKGNDIVLMSIVPGEGQVPEVTWPSEW